MKLVEQYQASVAAGVLQNDPAQRIVLQKLESILVQVLLPKPWWRIWPKPVQGLYLYGHVGVGKTSLLNLFYHALPEHLGERYHFHHFMQQVDKKLRDLQGTRNPIEKIASDFAKKTRVLCLDEFLVNDIADASILALLLKALFRRGVVLVATANTAPKDLYLNGVHRERFLPAIDLIEKYCLIHELPHHADYRLGRDSIAQAYITPLGKHADKTLMEQFTKLEPDARIDGTLTLQQREVPFLRCGQKAIWFEFKTLCQIPRSQLDYLELASRFEKIFVSHVPRFKPDDTVSVLLFMYLVDVMYDQHRLLILSAETSVETLYQEGSLLTSFERTRSRLTEMQSSSYLTQIMSFMP